MRMLAFFVVALVCPSCFLFSDFRRSSFSYSKNGSSYTTSLVVPKGYKRTDRQVDSAGNLVNYFYYPGEAVLYFAVLTDTSKQYQPINYSANIPRELYNATFYKGSDSSFRYWRENRFDHFRAGYRNVEDDAVFDSSLNYFSLHAGRKSP